jgi:hypothetical protein
LTDLLVGLRSYLRVAHMLAHIDSSTRTADTLSWLDWSAAPFTSWRFVATEGMLVACSAKSHVFGKASIAVSFTRTAWLTALFTHNNNLNRCATKGRGNGDTEGGDSNRGTLMPRNSVNCWKTLRALGATA